MPLYKTGINTKRQWSYIFIGFPLCKLYQSQVTILSKNILNNSNHQKNLGHRNFSFRIRWSRKQQVTVLLLPLQKVKIYYIICKNLIFINIMYLGKQRGLINQRRMSHSELKGLWQLPITSEPYPILWGGLGSSLPWTEEY